MGTTYPTTIQTFSNPTSTDLLENATTALDHDYQHTTENDTLFALQTKVGVDGSAVTTTHDYKLSGVATGDKAVSKTGIETLTNKTLTAPQINFGSDSAGDMIYRGLDGVTKRLALGTTGQILNVDSSGIPAWIANPAAADASTAVKGVSEKATTAEITAGTSTGGTGAQLFVGADAVGSPGAYKLVQYDSTGKLPPVDGSQLTGISTAIYMPQVLPGAVDTIANAGLISASALNAGIGSNDLYIAIGGVNSAMKMIKKYSKDATTGLYYDTNVYVDIGSTLGGTMNSQIFIAVTTSYVYAVVDYSTTTTTKVVRFDIGTLANGVDLTISGTAPTYSPQSHPMFTDGTYLYISDGTTATDLKKYSISGTTITYVSTISFTSFVKTYSAWCDGTNVYQFDGITISKWALAGGARTSTTTKVFNNDPSGSSVYWSVANGVSKSMVGIDSTKIMLFVSDMIPNQAGASIGIIGSRIFTLPVAKP